MTNFFHTHVHSEFSCLDGMADITRMAEKVAKLKQPALLAIMTFFHTHDHGNMRKSWCFSTLLFSTKPVGK
jgi:DNA polymerase III alpha subunit